MRYCSQCILPDTRPNLRFDDQGVCNACRQHGTRSGIDWQARAEAFHKVASAAKAKATGYDCLIPVSGGKDSHWQVLACLEHGLTPLAVTWRTPGRTAIGQANLDNLIRLGVDHIDFTINPETERKFVLKAFERYGTPGLPMHMALFNIPLTLAVRYEIPLVVWGENSAFEYGSKDNADIGFQLDRDWLKTYGVMHGTTAEDWVDEDLPHKSMAGYFGPSDEDMKRADVRAVFLGYYHEWTPEKTRKIACDHGFVTSDEGPRVGCWDFADIDDDFISIHHWLKWHKFGFTRLFDNLSIDIRNGRITREQAVESVREMGDQTPHEDIAKLCEFLQITPERFHEIADTFRNKDIWTRKDGVWGMNEFILPDWSFV